MLDSCFQTVNIKLLFKAFCLDINKYSVCCIAKNTYNDIKNIILMYRDYRSKAQPNIFSKPSKKLFLNSNTTRPPAYLYWFTSFNTMEACECGIVCCVKQNNRVLILVTETKASAIPRTSAPSARWATPGYMRWWSALVHPPACSVRGTCADDLPCYTHASACSGSGTWSDNLPMLHPPARWVRKHGVMICYVAPIRNIIIHILLIMRTVKNEDFNYMKIRSTLFMDILVD